MVTGLAIGERELFILDQVAAERPDLLLHRGLWVIKGRGAVEGLAGLGGGGIAAAEDTQNQHDTAEAAIDIRHNDRSVVEVRLSS